MLDGRWLAVASAGLYLDGRRQADWIKGADTMSANGGCSGWQQAESRRCHSSNSRIHRDASAFIAAAAAAAVDKDSACSLTP